MAGTIRAPHVLVAAQSPAIAGGMLQETTYLFTHHVAATACGRTVK